MFSDVRDNILLAGDDKSLSPRATTPGTHQYLSCIFSLDVLKTMENQTSNISLSNLHLSSNPFDNSLTKTLFYPSDGLLSSTLDVTWWVLALLQPQKWGHFIIYDPSWLVKLLLLWVISLHYSTLRYLCTVLYSAGSYLSFKLCWCLLSAGVYIILKSFRSLWSVRFWSPAWYDWYKLKQGQTLGLIEEIHHLYLDISCINLKTFHLRFGLFLNLPISMWSFLEVFILQDAENVQMSAITDKAKSVIYTI